MFVAKKIEAILCEGISRVCARVMENNKPPQAERARAWAAEGALSSFLVFAFLVDHRVLCVFDSKNEKSGSRSLWCAQVLCAYVRVRALSGAMPAARGFGAGAFDSRGGGGGGGGGGGAGGVGGGGGGGGD